MSENSSETAAADSASPETVGAGPSGAAPEVVGAASPETVGAGPSGAAAPVLPPAAAAAPPFAFPLGPSPCVPLPPAPPKSRRGPALVVAGALVAVAALGGVGYTELNGGDDHGKAASGGTWVQPSPSPTATEGYGVKSGGTHYGDLGKLLLPMQEGMRPGPDYQRFGNDVVLGAGPALDLVRGDVSGLTAKERKSIDNLLAPMHIQGAGLRTYSNDLGTLVVRIALVQMKNKQAARAGTLYFGQVAKEMSTSRKGPKVKGHDNAVCVLPPIDSDEELDTMICAATEGDLEVSFHVDGTVPLETQEATDLLAKQLDRIQDPGEAV